MRFEDILDAMDGAESYYTGYVIGLALLKANHPDLDVCKQEIPSIGETLDDWDMASAFRCLCAYLRELIGE